jgi:tetratricopeptide (TPR) repeat protein
MQQGKIDDAIAELLLQETNNPQPKGLDLEIGTAYYKKSDYPRAIEYLNKANAADPSNTEAQQLLGLSYYLGGHPAQAIPLLEKVQTWFPRANVDASYILGICYIQTKDYPQARKAFARMFDVGPDSAASYLFTARMLLRQEFDPIAEEYAQKAVALDPKLPLAHFLLGELYLYKSRVAEAVVEFQKELALNPAHAATYYKLADAYSRDTEIRRRGTPFAALHLARFDFDRTLHSDGKDFGKERRVRIVGALVAAGRHHGPEQPDNAPPAGSGLSRLGQKRRSRKRT